MLQEKKGVVQPRMGLGVLPQPWAAAAPPEPPPAGTSAALKERRHQPEEHPQTQHLPDGPSHDAEPGTEPPRGRAARGGGPWPWLPTYLLTYSDLERARVLWPPRLTCFSIKCSMRSCISRFCKRWRGLS